MSKWLRRKWIAFYNLIENIIENMIAFNEVRFCILYFSVYGNHFNGNTRTMSVLRHGNETNPFELTGNDGISTQTNKTKNEQRIKRWYWHSKCK